jgi:hypothetical protein
MNGRPLGGPEPSNRHRTSAISRDPRGWKCDRELLVVLPDSASTDQDTTWTSPETLVHSPYSLVGDTDQMVDTLVERRERWGLTYFTCWEEDIDLLAPVVDRLSGT